MVRKTMAILLTTAISAAILAGCGGSGDGGTGNAAADNGGAGNGNGEGTGNSSSSDGSFEFVGYPMAPQEPITISWYIGETGYTPNDSYASAADSPFHTGLIEMLGVDVEWSYPTTGTDSDQAFNLLMASADLPDIIYYKKVMSEAERYMDENVLRDLTPYIQDYSPAYYAFLQADKAYDKAMKTDSGRYYGYGFFREDGGWNDSYLGPVIRQDLLRDQGLDEPKTIADWDNVLKVFNEEYGMMLSFSWTRFRDVGLAGSFGSYASILMNRYIDDNGKVQLAQAQPEWRDYMAKLNEWWAAGYIDQDVQTLDDTAARSKALNDTMGISITSMGQLTSWESDANTSDNGAEWTGLQYPTGNDGTLSMVFGGYGIGPNAAGITTSCSDEKLEIVMRALDYAYTDEGHLYWNFGKEGVSWEYDANGQPAYTALVTEDPDGLNDAITKYGGSTWNGNCIQDTLLLYLKNTETAIAANDLWYYPNIDVTSKWKLPSSITLTTEENNRVDELNGAIKTYVEEQGVKYMTGAESTDTFDSYLAQLEAMGLQEMLDIYQAAYDRYLER